MKIIRLTAENVKRLKAVDITPEGNTVVIAGKNGQGKTSVLDSIWLALGGQAAAKGTAKPIREGKRHASVTVDLGDIVVTRQWTEKGSKLVVENATGLRYTSPQKLLDGFIGKLSFDPLGFALEDEKSQVETLLSLVELPFDPYELDQERKSLYAERTEQGRVVKQLEGQMAGFPDVSDAPGKPVDVAGLARKLQLISEEKHRQDALHEKLRQWKVDLAQTNERLAEMTRLRDAQQRSTEGLEKEVAAMAKPLGGPAIESELAGAEKANELYRAAQAKVGVEAQLLLAQARYDGFTESIEALDQAKAEGIAKAKMPIEGLAFDLEGGVTYNGVPLKQASAAEQLRVSVAMAMALNPKLRVIRITDGSLLDSDNMALLEQMAVENDYQIWIERVDDSGHVGIHIEDGEVQ